MGVLSGMDSGLGAVAGLEVGGEVVRDYSKVSPQFWIGTTGKALRAAGQPAQLLALYLMTNPHANMLGLYYLPKLFISHETGMTSEGASKALQRTIEAHFCSYDPLTEVVWVHEMAAYQIGDRLSVDDKRCKGVQNEYNALPENPFLPAFFARYSAAFNMKTERGNEPAEASPSQAPSEPHRSQEQEQEQEQDQEQEQETGDVVSLQKRAARKSEPTVPPDGLDLQAWERWQAYRVEIRKPLKPVSIPGAQRELAGFGADQSAIVEKSIAAGWTGLFPLKGGSSRPRERGVVV